MFFGNLEERKGEKIFGEAAPNQCGRFLAARVRDEGRVEGRAAREEFERASARQPASQPATVRQG